MAADGVSNSIISPQRKTAIVLFNLGGPDELASVKPFLFNLFNDRAIIGLPKLFRWPLAKFISGRRAPVARGIYDEIGGKSPIVENTQAQAKSLEMSLSGHGQVKVFMAMRYWHPFAHEAAEAVKNFAPDQVILLPLYPHFSTTTTGSSFTDWDQAAAKVKLNVATTRVCCYPTQSDFIRAHVQLIRTYYQEAAQFGKPRILFSAHGLPEKIIRGGDPYQSQIEATTQAILRELAVADVDYVNCYQSRVGPMKWLAPTTESEILRAGFEHKPIVVVPISFVSEHSETLVELDIEYADLAHTNGVDHYYRVPTLSGHAHFIAALSDICLKLKTVTGIMTADASRPCGPNATKCPCRSVEKMKEIA